MWGYKEHHCTLNKNFQSEPNKTFEKAPTQNRSQTQLLTIMVNFVIPLHISLPLYDQFAITLVLKNLKNHLLSFHSTCTRNRQQKNALFILRTALDVGYTFNKSKISSPLCFWSLTLSSSLTNGVVAMHFSSTQINLHVQIRLWSLCLNVQSATTIIGIIDLNGFKHFSVLVHLHITNSKTPYNCKMYWQTDWVTWFQPIQVFVFLSVQFLV